MMLIIPHPYYSTYNAALKCVVEFPAAKNSKQRFPYVPYIKWLVVLFNCIDCTLFPRPSGDVHGRVCDMFKGIMSRIILKFGKHVRQVNGSEPVYLFIDLKRQ